MPVAIRCSGHSLMLASSGSWAMVSPPELFDPCKSNGPIPIGARKNNSDCAWAMAIRQRPQEQVMAIRFP